MSMGKVWSQNAPNLNVKTVHFPTSESIRDTLSHIIFQGMSNVPYVLGGTKGRTILTNILMSSIMVKILFVTFVELSSVPWHFIGLTRALRTKMNR